MVNLLQGSHRKANLVFHICQPDISRFANVVPKTYRDVKLARKFFDSLDKFHDSYSRDVTARETKSGIESPRRVRIAVLDTGIDFGHPEIQAAEGSGRIRRGWCHSMVGNEWDFKDEDPGLHGTNCALLLHKSAPEADIYVEKISPGTNMRTYHAENIAKVRLGQVQMNLLDLD